MKRSLLILSLSALGLPVPLHAGPEILPFRALAIQDGGRTKPLDSFARDLARRVQGARAFGLDRIEGLEPAEWRDRPMIRVAHAGLRAAAALPAGRDRFSLRELLAHEGLRRAVAAVQAKSERDEDLDPVDREVSDLYGTLSTLSGVMSGDALRIVPVHGDPRATWLSLADLAQAPGVQEQRARTLVTALVLAYRDGDRDGVRAAAAALGRRLAESAPGVYPSARELGIEVHYNSLKPYRLAWLLYLLGFLSLLSSFPLASRAFGRLGMGLVIAGFLATAYGMTLRILISGRPPVTNMYETIIFVSWGGVLFALVFEAIYKVRFFGTCAAAVATAALLIADNVPIFDGSIAPLVPVLRDNMWLTVHVLTIMLGYAAFTLAMALGHLNLGLYFFAPGKAGLLKTLSLFLYRALQVGTLFLACGTMLGGVWASYSWGRFWGWDPKETWALIATLGYLAILHARFVGWIRDFGMAVGSLLGYLLVLMAWYGVNFVLGTGLHSYGFGSGGYWYVGSFVAFELLLITAAMLRRHAEAGRAVASATEVTPQPAQ
jgi:ABC-type transport system involved in cytochrome c biogenesis permease subunit